MRRILAKNIEDAVASLCLKANVFLRKDVVAALKKAYATEKNKRAKEILHAIIENAEVAAAKRLAICQDTGMPVVFLEIGQEVQVAGNLRDAVRRGVKSGYKNGSLRSSIVADPLLRGKPGYAPAVMHAEVVTGDKIKISVLPKGFGSENKTQLRMFKPTAGVNEIKDFIVEAVKAAGPDACPPYVVGVGIGGTADYAMILAKKALLRNVAIRVNKLERELLRKINALHIGPMGLGGKTTALGVNIGTYPTHIAGLPVAVNISCHALRSAVVVL